MSGEQDQSVRAPIRPRLTLLLHRFPLILQMASYLGAHVIGTTSSEDKAKIAKENGAEHVLQYGEGFVEKVLELTGGEGCAGIYDGVGKDTWEGELKIPESATEEAFIRVPES